MAERKRVVTRRTRAVKKGAGKFKFTREMIPSLANGKPEAKFISTYRDKAWKAFEKLDLPSTKEEAWRRTDLNRLETDSFKISDSKGEWKVPEDFIQTILEGQAGGKIVFTPNGTDSSFLSPEIKEKGIIFTDLQSAATEYPKVLKKILGQIVRVDEDIFSAMAAAFSRVGVFLYVPKGVQVEMPLQSLYWGTDSVSAHFSHVLVFLEDQSSAIFIQEYNSSASNSQHLHSGITEIFIGKGANLRFIEVQSWGDQVWNFSHERARVESDGNLEWIYSATGSHLTKNFSDIDLVGQGATGKMAGFYFTDGTQHLDHDTQQNHLAPNTTSDLLFKGALKDNSRSVWQGMIYVAPGAQKTDGYQSNPNLILDKSAKADSIPGLEIMADDVRCTHGATVGKIDPDEVFYLNTRGIPTEEAERLIVEGFFDPIMQKIPFENLRERLQKAVVDKLG
ncbi:MAG: Fe-S cluster assembly protein SufD [Anaerolineales bacterium]|jgi:Fe-S cluster assembly protein SufD